MLPGELTHRWATGEVLERPPTEGQVRHLARAAGRPAQDTTVEHDRHTDSFIEEEQREGVVPAGGAQPMLGVSDEVDLVLQLDSVPVAVPQPGQDVGVPGGQARDEAHVPALRVDESRRPHDHHAQSVVAESGVGEGAVERGLDDPVGLGSGILGHARAADRGTGQVGDDREDVVRSDLDTGDVGAVGDDPVQPCVGAAAVGACLADRRDQAGRLEPVDERGDRGPGQAGQRPQLAAG